MHIRTRNELISWLEDNCPGRIARAIQEGTVEHLGLFDPVPPGRKPGWIVKLTSRYHQTWYVIIQQSRHHTPWTYTVRISDSVPWQYWAGANTNITLHQGDNPEEYKELQDEEKRKS